MGKYNLLCYKKVVTNLFLHEQQTGNFKPEVTKGWFEQNYYFILQKGCDIDHYIVIAKLRYKGVQTLAWKNIYSKTEQ